MTITVIISVLFHFLILLVLMFLNVFIKVDTNRLRPPASSIEVNIINMDTVKPAQRRVVEKKEVVANVEKKPPVEKEKQEKKTAEPAQKLEVKSKQPEKQQTVKKTPVVKEKPAVAEISKAV